MTSLFVARAAWFSVSVSLSAPSLCVVSYCVYVCVCGGGVGGGVGGGDVGRQLHSNIRSFESTFVHNLVTCATTHKV